MAPFYVDETSGSDTSGNGSQESPYQSLAFALFTHGQSEAVLLRKDSTGTYEEPTQSALKKAKKNADGLEKKRKKQEEATEREAREKGEESQKREKLLEDSKKIVLVEDAILPKAVKVRRSLSLSVQKSQTFGLQAKISHLTDLRSKRIRVSGWVHRLRDQKGIIFVVLRDGTGYLQAVLSGVVVRALS